MPGSAENPARLAGELTPIDRMFTGADKSIAQKAYEIYRSYFEAGVIPHDLNRWMYFIQDKCYFLGQNIPEAERSKREAELQKLQDGPRGGRRVSDNDWQILLQACGYRAAK